MANLSLDKEAQPCCLHYTTKDVPAMYQPLQLRTTTPWHTTLQAGSLGPSHMELGPEPPETGKG